MYCYAHPDLPAAGQCNECNRFLCHNCLDKYNIPVCNHCVSDTAAGTRGEAVQVLVRLAASLVVGTLFMAGIGAPLYAGLIFGYIIAGIPAGWYFLSRITPQVFLFMPLVGWLIYFMAKLMLATAIGPVALVFRIRRAINSIRNAKRLDAAAQTH